MKRVVVCKPHIATMQLTKRHKCVKTPKGRIAPERCGNLTSSFLFKINLWCKHRKHIKQLLHKGQAYWKWTEVIEKTILRTLGWSTSKWHRDIEKDKDTINSYSYHRETSLHKWWSWNEITTLVELLVWTEPVIWLHSHLCRHPL